MQNQDINSNEAIIAGKRITLIGLFANIILVIIKLIGGIFGKSQALLADAAHSISDLFSDIIVYFGFKWGRKQADENHPYGHGRIETVAALLVGIILLVGGGLISYDAIESIYSGEKSMPGFLAIIIAGISILIKELLYHITIKISKRIRSSALKANAWHHRTDAFSSIAVLAGLIAARINPDWYLADSFAAIIVSLFVLRIASTFISSAVHELIDTAPDERTLSEFLSIAEKCDGVLQAHDIKARFSGSIILVEMHVVVDSNITVHDGHEIAEDVKKSIMNKNKKVGEVLVHIEPESEIKK